MSRKSAEYVPFCEIDICSRKGQPMNSARDLRDVWKPGVAKPLHTCGSQYCLERANALGYLPDRQPNAPL
jgi:hypothetical protein